MSKQFRNPMKASLKGDELKAFVLTSSTFVSEGLVSPLVSELWGFYQSFFRIIVQPEQSPEDVKSAIDYAHRFAKGVESAKMKKCCTINLHLLTVELLRQPRLIGPTSLQLAMWIERFLLVLVRKTKMKVSKNPDITMLKNYQV